MPPDPLQPILDGIFSRQASVNDLGADLRQRIDELGQVTLDSQARQAAFGEILDAITPPGFDVFPFPDECRVDPADHSIELVGAVVDQARRQVVGVINRKLVLDIASVKHEFLRLQRPYRGAGLTPLLLERSLAFYDSIGIRHVHVHAALETGRWYWARLGFDFATPGDRGLVATWGTIALMALSEKLLPPDSPARRWAQLGSGDPPVLISLEDLRAKMEVLVAAGLADPATRAQFEDLENAYSGLFGVGWMDVDRFVACAEDNGFAVADDVPIGRAIMLTGPDWNGVFDLSNQGARDAFEEELNRALKKSAQPP